MTRCNGRVYRGMMSTNSRCRRQGHHESANGYHYCTQHLPENVREKNEEKAKKRDRNFKENIRPQIHGKDMLRVLREIASNDCDDPVGLAQRFIDRYDLVN